MAPSNPPNTAPITSTGPTTPTGNPTPTQAAEAMVLAINITNSATQPRLPNSASFTVS